MEFIKDLLRKLGNEYFFWTLIGIIALVIIIFLCIVLHVSRKKARAEKTKEEFKQSSLQSLTPEEIDNISNNSANPEEVKEYLTSEVSVSTAKKPSKKTTSKAKTTQKVNVDEVKSKPKTTTKSKSNPADNNVKQGKKIETNKQSANEITVNNQPNETKKVTSKKATQPKTEEVNKKPIEEPTKTKKATQPKKEEVKKPIVSEPTNAKKTANEKPSQTNKTPQKQVELEPKRQYTGKWKISQEEDGFVATLTASNGGTLLVTEKYKSLSGVKSGIETIKKNIDGGNFAISVDKYGHYRFKLLNLSNRLICVSEDYSSKNKCEKGIESVKRFAKTDNVIIEEK